MAETVTTATTTMNPPAANTTTTPPPPQNAETVKTWTDNLSPEMKTFVTEQGFKEPSDVLMGYQGLLKLRGVAADKLIRTPDSYTDTKEQESALNAIYDRLGRPKTAQEYGIENKEQAEDTKFMADTFHKAGLTKTQAENVAKAFLDKTKSAQTSANENQQLMARQSVEALKREWGSGFDNNLNVAKAGQKALGWDDKTVDAIAGIKGVGETIKMLNDVGRRVGESQFIAGNKGDVTHTPDTAQVKIKQLMTDRSFTDRLMSGDAQARAQWNALHEQMGAGQNYS